MEFRKKFPPRARTRKKYPEVQNFLARHPDVHLTLQQRISGNPLDIALTIHTESYSTRNFLKWFKGIQKRAVTLEGKAPAGVAEFMRKSERKGTPKRSSSSLGQAIDERRSFMCVFDGQKFFVRVGYYPDRLIAGNHKFFCIFYDPALLHELVASKRPVEEIAKRFDRGSINIPQYGETEILFHFPEKTKTRLLMQTLLADEFIKGQK